MTRERKRKMARWTPKRIVELREEKYQETQEVFCHRLRVVVGTLRFWEQGRGEPSGPAEEVFDRLLEDFDQGKIRPLPEITGRRAVAV